ncbi:hypothetical protein D9M70_509920 [compost metagenome]
MAASDNTWREARTQWAMVATGSVSSSNWMSDSGFGLAGFSDTGAALLVKPVSRTYSMELEPVRPQLNRSRMNRRCCAGWMMPTRVGSISAPAEPVRLVMAAFTGTVKLPLAPPAARTAQAS